MLKKYINTIIEKLPFISDEQKNAIYKDLNPEISYKKDLVIEKKSSVINVYRKNECIRTSLKNELYVEYDITENFDLYYSAVKPVKKGNLLLVDYSQPRLHKVVGYELHKIKIPSIMEPIDAVKQYIDFFKPTSDSVILDLGSYTGLTAILFDMEISKANKKATGRVITVEADSNAYDAVCENLKSYYKKTKRSIDVLHGAVWNKLGFIEFSSEGNLASSIVEVFKRCRGVNKTVPTYTLSSIVKKYNLNKVDFIKCDIEGAEAQMVEDEEFFKNFHPKIIMELHDYDGSTERYDKVKSFLEKYGYTVKRVVQEDGFVLPLLECE